MQVHSAVGFFICFFAMLGIYYNDVWGSRSQPFMSTRLRAENGKAYPVAKVFVGGILDEVALKQYGVPRLTGAFAYAMLMANAGVRNLSPAKSVGKNDNSNGLVDWCSYRTRYPFLG